MGISPGGLLSDAEVFGNLDEDRTEMFVEAINQVLAAWAGEAPHNIRGTSKINHLACVACTVIS